MILSRFKSIKKSIDSPYTGTDEVRNRKDIDRILATEVSFANSKIKLRDSQSKSQESLKKNK